MENQESISAWAKATFGTATPASFVARMLREFAELTQKVVDDPLDPKIGEEIADVGIMLMDLSERLGFDFTEQVAVKMAANRKRQWAITKHGHGQHVEPPPSADAVMACLDSFSAAMIIDPEAFDDASLITDKVREVRRDRALEKAMKILKVS